MRKSRGLTAPTLSLLGLMAGQICGSCVFHSWVVTIAAAHSSALHLLTTTLVRAPLCLSVPPGFVSPQNALYLTGADSDSRHLLHLLPQSRAGHIWANAPPALVATCASGKYCAPRGGGRHEEARLTAQTALLVAEDVRQLSFGGTGHVRL
jgi:hypothetical protein